MVEKFQSLKVGDEVFNISSGGVTVYYRRMRVERLTAKQIITIDQMRRRTRYWRETGREVGPHTVNHLTAGPPPEYAKEPKHLIGKPLPEID